MAIVGFNFTKVVAERNANVTGKVSINNNVAIKDVEKADLAVGTNDQAGLKFIFEFTSGFEPKLGNILLNGEVLAIEDVSLVEEILKGWKKDKKVKPELLTPVLNYILTKANVFALILGNEVNLPPLIPLPKVDTNKKN